jgi:hypothetical protein
MLRKSVLLVLAGAAVLALVSTRSRPPEIQPRPAPPPSIASTRSIPSIPSTPNAVSRDLTLATIVQRAAEQGSDLAEELASTLSAENPADARALQGYLIVALGRAGDHERAAALAADSPPEDRINFLTIAYAAWAQHEPETALDSALNLDDPARQRAAFQAAVSGWARRDPQRLAECAAEFPDGPEKKLALRLALRAWAKTRPAEAFRWYDGHRAALVGISRDELADND